jgi:hypothetical protein
MGAEIFVLNASFLAVDLRQRQSLVVSRASLISFAIRLVYLYAAVSLILGIGGGFYVLAFVVVLTLGRTMASCWALLTALE